MVIGSKAQDRPWEGERDWEDAPRSPLCYLCGEPLTEINTQLGACDVDDFVPGYAVYRDICDECAEREEVGA